VSSDPAAPPVVILHGLGRTQLSMLGMRRHLERHGFATWSRTYPSRTMPVDVLADLVADWIERDLGPDARPLAVTHSLGGVLVRLMSPRVSFSGVAMLAPPNRGSRLARALSDLAIFHGVMGPAAGDLTRPETWPVPACPTAVIAGTRAASVGNPVSWLSAGIRAFPDGAAHDGTVAVDETQLPDMARFLEVDASHTWIMNHRAVRAAVVEFLISACKPLKS